MPLRTAPTADWKEEFAILAASVPAKVLTEGQWVNLAMREFLSQNVRWNKRDFL